MLERDIVMLFYEEGFLCDTSTGTRQVVSRQELTHYLFLGLDIKAVAVMYILLFTVSCCCSHQYYCRLEKEVIK